MFLCSCKVCKSFKICQTNISGNLLCLRGWDVSARVYEANRIKYDPMKSTKDKIIYQLDKDGLLESKKLMLKSSLDTFVTLLFPATRMQAVCGPASLVSHLFQCDSSCCTPLDRHRAPTKQM